MLQQTSGQDTYRKQSAKTGNSLQIGNVWRSSPIYCLLLLHHTATAVAASKRDLYRQGLHMRAVHSHAGIFVAQS